MYMYNLAENVEWFLFWCLMKKFDILHMSEWVLLNSNIILVLHMGS